MAILARLATEGDAHLPAYDHTALSAIATCPTWGLTTYVHHKTMSGGGRALALEAGQVLHDCGAAISLWQLRAEGRVDHFEHHRRRLFPHGRDGAIFDDADSRNSIANQLRGICERAIATSGYYDEPSDTNRTITNLEDCASYYVDQHPWITKPVWVADEDDPTSDIGIEMPVEMVVRTPAGREIRYTGRCDKIQWTDRSRAELEWVDIKTTSMNMAEAWDASFVLSHQFTGYGVYASLFTGRAVWNGSIHGIRIPVPKRNVYNGIKLLPLTRSEHHIDMWAQWIDHCLDILEKHTSAPQHAPKYTHACNRYFRPCPLLPMCDGDAQWRDEAFKEMETREWNPLADE